MINQVIVAVMVVVMVLIAVMVTAMVKVEKYMKLHRELLGSYDSLHLPVRPAKEALERMRGGKNVETNWHRQHIFQGQFKSF